MEYGKPATHPTTAKESAPSDYATALTFPRSGAAVPRQELCARARTTANKPHYHDSGRISIHPMADYAFASTIGRDCHNQGQSPQKGRIVALPHRVGSLLYLLYHAPRAAFLLLTYHCHCHTTHRAHFHCLFSILHYIPLSAYYPYLPHCSFWCWTFFLFV